VVLEQKNFGKECYIFYSGQSERLCMITHDVTAFDCADMSNLVSNFDNKYKLNLNKS